MNVKKPVLIIIAGPNGSGKTSVTEKILKHEWTKNCIYVNPDNIAKEKFGDWNSPDAVLKAVKYAEGIREEAIEKKQSLIFETVFSSDDKIKFLLKAKKNNYFIRLFFICTDSPTINASRIAQRVMTGGHSVPIDKIISRYSKSIANCAYVSKLVDRLYIYDNSTDFADPKLLFRFSSGKLEKKYHEINDWAKIILKQV